jgi:hypothetical protein
MENSGWIRSEKVSTKTEFFEIDSWQGANFRCMIMLYRDPCWNTVKTEVSFRHLLRHRNSASTSVISTPKNVCLRVKTTLLSAKTTLLSVKTTLC